ncbi:unnamed protein product, partial [Allacma fusca]
MECSESGAGILNGRSPESILDNEP